MNNFGSNTRPGEFDTADSSTSSVELLSKENRLDERVEEQLQSNGVDRHAAYSKLGVYLVLFVAATITAGVSYLVTMESRQSLLESEFHASGKHIVDVVSEKIQDAYSTVRELSVSITAAALDSDTTWPNVTVSHFPRRTVEFFARTGADVCVFAPLVPHGQQAAWEAYAAPASNAARIHRAVGGTFVSETHYAPLWQQSRPTSPHHPDDNDDEGTFDDFSVFLLQDLLTLEWFRQMTDKASALHESVFSKIVSVDFLIDREAAASSQDGFETQNNVVHDDDTATAAAMDPHSTVMDVVYKDFGEETEENRAGFVFFSVLWSHLFSDLLPPDDVGYLLTVDDGCGTVMSFELNGVTSTFVGYEDYHDTKYNYLFDSFSFNNRGIVVGGETEAKEIDVCIYTVTVYPTAAVLSRDQKGQSLLYAIGIYAIFALAGCIFWTYDAYMRRRQRFLETQARKTTAIVASLFPETVQKRLIEELEAANPNASTKSVSRSRKLQDFLSQQGSLEDHHHHGDGLLRDSPPIADLFPECTIMFADLAGFTAWSSMREPPQVFTLLETLYHEMDVIAKQRRVFKVETIGDCYVAVAGLPTPRKDHAVVMGRFARDCLEQTNMVTKQLEERLGPDTGDLCMRIGLHSGPVTAGVLRGEKARFQLFGDTVNTTARIESLGQKNRIHISEDTAKCIMDAGKGFWLQKRLDAVSAKGKGKLITYWLDTKNKSASVSSGGTRISDSRGTDTTVPTTTTTNVEETPVLNSKERRLIRWNVDVLSKLLTKVMLRRKMTASREDHPHTIEARERSLCDRNQALEEVVETIRLPRYNSSIAIRGDMDEAALTAIDSTVSEQLLQYVSTVAALYRNNPFHNFEHVSHVTMSVSKLLSRIIAPDWKETGAQSKVLESLHEHAYGITSDPLTQFAVVFSGLIHDVDHQGVSNAQLVKEGGRLAAVYNGRSVAEQNSLDIAWKLLMSEGFSELRKAIYTTEEELKRFRQLVVNAVMATDIMDKELGAARKARWEKAFSMTASTQENVDRKATIVIEHLIQASDVSHTMQHWHVYRKWNQRLFEEMTRAYIEGRLEHDPADGWYKGEIGFFDFYIIPLARKLKDCGVFGVSSDEYLNYATKNREEWEARGQDIVAEMVQARDKQ